MNLIYELSIMEAKQLPDFTGTDDDFVNITLNGLIIDKRMLNVINKIGNDQLEQFSTGDFLVINALYYDNSVLEKLRSCLKHLTDAGIVEHVARNKYVLARNLYEAVGKSGVHTRRVGLDRETNKELIVKHIRENGDKGTPLKELLQVLPGKSRSQIQVLLRELRTEGRIYCKGKTSNARWYVIENTV